jgi:hypothetical protein
MPCTTCASKRMHFVHWYNVHWCRCMFDCTCARCLSSAKQCSIEHVLAGVRTESCGASVCSAADRDDQSEPCQAGRYRQARQSSCEHWPECRRGSSCRSISERTLLSMQPEVVTVVVHDVTSLLTRCQCDSNRYRRAILAAAPHQARYLPLPVRAASTTSPVAGTRRCLPRARLLAI